MHTSNTSLKSLSQTELNLVKENFENIYPIFFHGKLDKSKLVPSLWGNRIYHSDAGWKGRLLSIIYLGIIAIAGERYKNKRLQEVILKTNLIYLKLEKEIAPHLNKYQEYLVSKCEIDLYPSERLIHHCRTQIRRFYESTHPYTHLFYRANSKAWKFCTAVQCRKNANVADNVKIFSSEYYRNSDKEAVSFFNRKTYRKLKESMHIIALEGILHDHLPIKSLKTISLFETQEKLDSSLSKMCGKLKRMGNTLDIRIFHKALISIVKVVKRNYQKITELPEPKVIHIEKALTDGGFEGFHLTDAKHVKWREDLREGDVFYYKNGKQKLARGFLGKQLSGKAEGIDQHLVFEVKNEKNVINDDFVLKIGLNRAALELRQAEREQEQYGIPTVDMPYLDPKGRFALMEKLVKPLNQFEWTSDRKKNESEAEPIRNWIRSFLDKPFTPKNLSRHYLMFARDGMLKTIKGTKQEKFNVMALENLAYEFANGNLGVYSYVVNPLYAHSKFSQYLKFFETVIIHALSGEGMSVSGLGTLEVPVITDAGIIERSEQLYQDIINLKKNLWDRISGKFRLVTPSTYQETLKNEILRIYRSSKTFGRLWPTFSEEYLQIAMESAGAIKKV